MCIERLFWTKTKQCDLLNRVQAGARAIIINNNNNNSDERLNSRRPTRGKTNLFV